MTLTFGAEGVMEHLWSQVDKTEDGNHIRYSIQDVDALWWMGFVDTEKYPLKRWREVFEPYKQPDGTFVLNHAAFISLEKYRYTGEIKIPFDPMLINEGKYTDEGINELFELSISPSCYYSPQDKKRFLDSLKEKYRESAGLIKIGKPAKNEIKQFIDNSPSPLRSLELLLDRMIEDGVDEELASQLEENETARVTEEAAKQVSRFSAAPASKTEMHAKQLKELHGVQRKPAKAAEEVPEKKGTELKKIRRSRKGMRG